MKRFTRLFDQISTVIVRDGNDFVTFEAYDKHDSQVYRGQQAEAIALCEKHQLRLILDTSSSGVAYESMAGGQFAALPVYNSTLDNLHALITVIKNNFEKS